MTDEDAIATLEHAAATLATGADDSVLMAIADAAAVLPVRLRAGDIKPAAAFDVVTWLARARLVRLRRRANLAHVEPELHHVLAFHPSPTRRAEAFVLLAELHGRLADVGADI